MFPGTYCPIEVGLEEEAHWTDAVPYVVGALTLVVIFFHQMFGQCYVAVVGSGRAYFGGRLAVQGKWFSKGINSLGFNLLLNHVQRHANASCCSTGNGSRMPCI